MEFQNPNPNDRENHTSNLHHHTYHGHETQLTHSSFEEIDSTCSTPYVSAPSSPGRGSGPVNGGFYYSAPASPMHFALTSSSYISSLSSPDYADGSFPVGFEFGSGSGASGSMSSADELFLNGKIRPMKLSTHLESPQVLAPLLDLEEQEEEEDGGGNEEKIRAVDRGRSDLRVVRDKSMRRRTRSLSPLRSSSTKWDLEEEEEMVSGFIENMKKTSGEKVDENGNININGDVNEENSNSNNGGKNDESAPSSASLSASSSRSSSAGRSSKRWVFLKDFLRSKSEGRSNNKFWSTISFSPTLLNNKEKKQPTNNNNNNNNNNSSSNSSSNVVNGGGGGGGGVSNSKEKEVGANSGGGNNGGGGKGSMKKPVNGIGKRRRMPHPSAHEMHYTANRAQAEELRKKTYLPYKQGLLGCLGFSSKGYGAMNGFARALNPVSSR